MVVGICRIDLALPGNDSLKGKRAVLRGIIDRATRRFNVALAEVDAQDAHRRAVLGFAVVSSDRQHANRMVDGVVAFIEENAEARLVARRMELLSWNAPVDGGREEDILSKWSDFEVDDEP